jgi:hypothetical protein
VLVLPVALQPAFVQNFSAESHIYSNPNSDAVDFGIAGPQFTTFTVVAPQVGGRIYVLNPQTKGYGWINASEVGPASAPDTASVTTPVVATSEQPQSASPGLRYVQNFSEAAILYSGPNSAAVELGRVGKAMEFLVVIGEQQGLRLYVFNPVTENYGWIDAADVGPSEGP